MKYLNLILIISLVSITSCNNEEFSNGIDHFIFGGYAGECVGNCAHFYLVQNGEVYEDDVDYWFGTLADLKFSSTPLSKKKYDAAIALYNVMPRALVELPDSTFGQPDAYDQGGWFIGLREGVNIHNWTIDTNPEVLPDYLQSYREDFIETMAIMKE